MPPKIDIIIPVYNESENLVPLITRLDHTFRVAKLSYHLYVIDDHSTDNSLRVLASLKNQFPLTVARKQGQPGKAFSILEGAALSTAPFLAMIDGDLQYPPEVIPEMLTLAMEQQAIVIAKRNDFHEARSRKFLSRGFKWFFGNVLHGLHCDVQSGLKVFSREVITRLTIDQVTPWTLDIPLLKTAQELGFQIKEVEITFGKRQKGKSKIKLVDSIKEIGGQAIAYKVRSHQNLQIFPEKPGEMLGAGMYHKGKKFITHTTLQPQDSAVTVVTKRQKVFLLVITFLLTCSLLFAFLSTIKIVVAFLSFIYFVDVVFNLFVILKSLHQPPEIQIMPDEIAAMRDHDLPIYTVMCPLYKEAHVLPQFVAAIEKMAWPKHKLDVMLLLEADDTATIDAAEQMNLPAYIRVLVIPDAQPKTKPKACNYGLHFAKGKYLVIYDAEDIPDPLQLKKVYLAFMRSTAEIKCIQAKLNFYNPHQNLLTRFFTAEYSLWFDVILTGLQSIHTSLPLGGTSNHFRTRDLKDLEGWDSFNVTEDADLGIRLFKRGGRTAIIDSITLEEANSSWSNWLRQRSRWIKGYMQTYLVHMRNPYQFFKEYGWHALLFQLVMGGKIAFMLINPLMWILTISYFSLYALVGPAIESFYPPVVFGMAVTSLVFGNFLFVYYYMIGAAKRGQWSILKWVFLIPIYWLLVSVAAGIALYQLVVKPHYWEKTVHGLHISKKVKAEIENLEKDFTAEVIAEIKTNRAFLVSIDKIKLYQKIRSQLQSISSNKFKKLIDSGEYRASLLYVIALFGTNVINFASSAYLGNTLKLVDFGYMNTFISLLYLSNIFFQTYSGTVNYKVAFLVGKEKEKFARYFWQWSRKKSLLFSVILSGVWVISTPLLMKFFNIPVAAPFLMFTPLIILGLLAANDRGILKGKFSFGIIAVMTIGDPIVRFLSTIVLAQLHLEGFLYLTIPAGIFTAFAIGSVFAHRRNPPVTEKVGMDFPFRFWFISILGAISGIAFFSLDNILASHFLTASEVGKYALLGVLGKMVFFIGSITAGFVLPIVARNEGKNISSKKVFYSLLAIISLMSFFGYLCFAIGPALLASRYLGEKMQAIAPYLPVYGLGVMFFTISQTFVSYHLAKKEYSFPFTAFLLTMIEVVSFGVGRHSLNSLVFTMSLFGFLNFAVLGLLHLLYPSLKLPLANFKDFLELFNRSKKPGKEKSDADAMRILVFNWRDTKHTWSGGAEKYIHEVMAGLVKEGRKVTLFCGNDGKNPRNEVIDGIQIIRRGGFYTVYFWAFIYYVVRLRHYTDVIIDCENGIPFMTPLYSRKQIHLIIHHVHQEVFRTHLQFPLSAVAIFLEARLMPWLYQYKKIITVSESSKKEILALGFNKGTEITVIEPGIDADLYSTGKKTSYPSISYVGRLKDYKNIDTAIKAFATVVHTHPTAKFFIAGEGESIDSLKGLTKKLKVEKSILFLDKVTDTQKAQLFTKSWAAIQPSMIEGWGITVIEANACGTPVIASNVNGLRDSIQDGKTGLLFPAKNDAELAKLIRIIFKNKDLRVDLSRAAFKWSKQFTWSQAIEHFSDLLNRDIILNENMQLYAEEQGVNV